MHKTNLLRSRSLVLRSLFFSVGAHADNKTSIAVPVTGAFADSLGGVGKFAGSLTVEKFASQGNTMYAVGLLTGTLTDSAGTYSVPYSIPLLSQLRQRVH